MRAMESDLEPTIFASETIERLCCNNGQAKQGSNHTLDGIHDDHPLYDYLQQ